MIVTTVVEITPTGVGIQRHNKLEPKNSRKRSVQSWLLVHGWACHWLKVGMQLTQIDVSMYFNKSCYF